jgi:acyl carrier protein
MKGIAMDRSTLRQTLIKLLEDNVGRNFDNLKEDDDLRTGLGLDSVDMVTLVIEIQSQLGIMIASEELGQIVKVGDLLDMLQAKIAAAATRPSMA